MSGEFQVIASAELALAPPGGDHLLPALILHEGDRAGWRYVDVDIPYIGSDSSLVLTMLVSGLTIPTDEDDQERSPPVEEWAHDSDMYGYRKGLDDRGDSGIASRVPGLWFDLDVPAQLVSPDAPGSSNLGRPHHAGAPYLSLAMSPPGMQTKHLCPTLAGACGEVCAA